jgi:hypothetical protein
MNDPGDDMGYLPRGNFSWRCVRDRSVPCLAGLGLAGCFGLRISRPRLFLPGTEHSSLDGIGNRGTPRRGVESRTIDATRAPPVLTTHPHPPRRSRATFSRAHSLADRTSTPLSKPRRKPGHCPLWTIRPLPWPCLANRGVGRSGRRVRSNRAPRGCVVPRCLGRRSAGTTQMRVQGGGSRSKGSPLGWAQTTAHEQDSRRAGRWAGLTVLPREALRGFGV